ncbi:MAG: hypothetical protein KA479_12490 [Saprospiraceae bacterium]|jgi:hypothetical protein|nr:hypothetical protein [Saprospiraceae bacterium]
MNVSFPLFITLFLFFGSCQTGQNKDIGKEFEWLAGTWKLLDTETPVYETWVLEGQEWQGESFAAVSGMKVPTEIIKLYREGENIIFSQRVKDRDNGDPVDFVLSKTDKNSYTFSNPDYPFPSEITYSRISDVAMKVKISGRRNGNYTEVFLEYVRK